MSNESGAPQGNPGDIVNWPMLKIVYRTDPEKIAALLPPGIEPGANPNVNVTIYNYPVPDVPELGIVMTVDADYNGTPGEYTLGYGIDQESAIFNSQQINGQPKYPCTTDFYRCGPVVTARCTHQGYTFVEFKGMSTGRAEDLPEFDQNEWWIKVSRACGLVSEGYDFPPHVVHVHSRYGTAWREEVEGDLVLRDSPWDPIASLLPMR
jgi:acetoacetate decarboxylase